jgi:uncharacterized membrane protein
MTVETITGGVIMASVMKTVDVAVPVRTAYNQWTQFEEFPQFMEGVEEVRQLDETHLHWRARVAGREKEWDAEITEQLPDERVAWRNTDGQDNAGVVTFHKLDDGKCRVTVQIDAEPEGLLEKTGDAMGVLIGACRATWIASATSSSRGRARPARGAEKSSRT